LNDRYLTKSRFSLALECPAKLFYTGKREYANQSLEDSFLAALAEGGFQVGELAKQYFPGGHQIDTLDYQEALSRTAELLALDSVVIYEGAFRHGNLFIRADIVEKRGSSLFLYEVKAKSFDPGEEDPFLTASGGIASSWKPYLYDVAFQKHVISKAYPGFQVFAHLMMADKTAQCPTEGLNQKFRIVKGMNGRKSVAVAGDITAADLSPRILCTVGVDGVCERIYSATVTAGALKLGFTSMVEFLAGRYAADDKIPTPVNPACAGCEFVTTDEDEEKGLLSGRKECWKADLGWADGDFREPTVLDVWDFRKKSTLLREKRVKMSQMNRDDISPRPGRKKGISRTERQWLQIEKTVNHDESSWLERDGLLSEMESWVFPLHFIDFETTMVAIPFNAGRRPYEGVAFQFSHHMVHQDGTVEHAGEYLNAERGVFPNYSFARALKAQLENDRGSIFRYSHHENTFLCTIYRQLMDDPSVPDRGELCDFIRSITHATGNSAEQWVGERNMVDQLELVKKYFYDPAMGGSNSIKKVLPAMLNRSNFLKETYSRPIYGAAGGIRSLNFSDWCWVVMENGRVKDPYLLLPRMFTDLPEKENRLLSDDDRLKDGGGALTAYARMQFEEMSDYERGELSRALLKYCELDTMAMVMIHQGWLDLLGS